MAQDQNQLTDNASKIQGILDQKEVAYTPVSITPGQACSKCMWYRNHYCHIVSNYPETIEPNGWCKEYREFTQAPIDITQTPIPVVIVEPTISDDDSAEMALPTTRRGLKELVFGLLKGIAPSTPIATSERPFTVFKGMDDQWFWMARHTGKWVDRETEIIANKAHDEYVARVQKGLVPMPELWTWHKKGTMHGVADFVWKSGGFTLALGHFVGSKEQIARAVKYYQEHDIKLSHMFHYPKNAKKDNVYYAYNTVEITTLPDGAEAFPYTSFEGFNMPFTKAQEEMIRGIGGDDMVKRAEAADTKALGDTAKLDNAGIASKGLENFEGSTIPGDDEIKAITKIQADFEGRLKTIEGIGALMTSLNDTVKTLTTQLAASQQAATDALAKANANEKALLEYQAVAPPASKSNDTLLSGREKSLLEQIAESAKDDGSISLIERALGKQPTVVS